MKPYHRKLRGVWDTFARHGDLAPLRRFLQEFPHPPPNCGHDYPSRHRVADVQVNHHFYRLTRCANCNEELTLTPLDRSQTHPLVDGVPYWLTGPALRRWVDDERTNPAKDTIDWNQYR